MAYRDPIFYFRHALRKAGSGALGGSAFATGFGRERTHDSGTARLARFNGTGANQYVSCDRGALYALEPSLDRLIVPAGHNLAGATVQLFEKSTAPASGTDGSSALSTVASAGLQLYVMGSGVQLRHFTFNVSSSGTAWEFGELWLTHAEATSANVNLDVDWTDAYEPNVLETRLRSGERYRSELGVAARRLNLVYRGLSGNDLTLFQTMRTETANGLYPLYVSPPDDTELPVLMLVEGGFRFQQDRAAPQAGATYTLELSLVEQLA